MKKLVSVLIALAMVLSFATVTAVAEDYSDYTIKIYSNSNSPERVTWLIDAARKAGFNVMLDDNSVTTSHGFLLYGQKKGTRFLWTTLSKP